MKPLDTFLDACRDGVRAIMHGVAKLLNSLSGGYLSPTTVTITGLLAHIPIAWLIATNEHNVLAAILLVIFGLFDTLDGELARLQKRVSNAGMLLDATTDRMKEIILYMGIGAALVPAYVIYQDSYGRSFSHYAPDNYMIAIIIAALGGSLLVSYIKAKGETAIKDQKLTPNEINRLFQDGLARFEVRMFILVVGLITNWLYYAVIVIAILTWLTAISRLIKISRKLQ